MRPVRCGSRSTIAATCGRCRRVDRGDKLHDLLAAPARLPTTFSATSRCNVRSRARQRIPCRRGRAERQSGPPPRVHLGSGPSVGTDIGSARRVSSLPVRTSSGQPATLSAGTEAQHPPYPVSITVGLPLPFSVTVGRGASAPAPHCHGSGNFQCQRGPGAEAPRATPTRHPAPAAPRVFGQGRGISRRFDRPLSRPPRPVDFRRGLVDLPVEPVLLAAPSPW